MRALFFYYISFKNISFKNIVLKYNLKMIKVKNNQLNLFRVKLSSNLKSFSVNAFIDNSPKTGANLNP